MSLRVIAFDLDGTLVDSEPGIVRCMEKTAAAMRLPEGSVERWRDLIGIPVAEQMKRLLPPERHSEVDHGVALYRSFYFALPVEEMGAPFPGIAELLESLRSRVGLALATSKGKRGVEKLLQHLRWESLFHPVITPEALARPKPDPESLRRILGAHGAGPEEALAVGDSRFDVEMAKAAGVEVWGVSWGVHRAEQLFAAGAARCLSSVSELREALERRL